MIAGLLNQTISIYSRSSYDAQGREVVGSATGAKARVQPKQRNKLGPNNSVITIVAIAYVLPTVTVEVDDKIVHNSTNYKVFAKYPVPDGQGNTDHIELELMKWQI